ncbi:porin [Bradyrhizobium sp. LHD-71]|uniref:porin n=1 Tax=Bradyrhizobium sp. LHD-71 TaxID=3072141 RepID=UPI0028105848|nr:porin [Bradyrhizobium sp. LHD-71]MDQ8726206.1 porin [Bradyrhizobium sp. LHD-71]
MTMMRSLLLGSAAGMAALTGAQAADLPVKAKPVEYVKICSLYGAGFYYIPGTDTCIRIGGHIRAELNFNSRMTHLQSWNTGNGNNTQTRDRDYFFARSRVFTNVDTRTQTAFGTLRTFSVVRAEVNTPTGLLSSGVGSSAGVIAIDSGIIQWGGFTIGRAGTSYFDNPWHYAFEWGTNGWLGNPDTAGGRFVVAYTHQFGNGISGTLSLEDGKERKRGIYNGANPLTILGVAPGVDTRGGNTWPEIVGQLRIDQAWGGFHLSGMIVNNHVAYDCGGASGTTTVQLGGCSELSGAVSDKIGGGVNAAFKFNVPTGVNDALYIGGTWSKGATTNVFANIGQGSSFGIYGGSDTFYDSIVGGYVLDSVYTSAPRSGAGITVTSGGQELTTAYGGSIAFEHGWNPEWRTSVYAGAQVLDYSDTANAILCSRFGVGSASGTLTNAVGVNVANTGACNWDYRIYGAGTRTFWTPVRDLTIGVEFMWTNHHVSHGDNVVYNQPVISGFKPNAAYEIKDQNVFSGIFSVRRFF